eukprot:4871188-Prymnesium_polylepis.1
MYVAAGGGPDGHPTAFAVGLSVRAGGTVRELSRRRREPESYPSNGNDAPLQHLAQRPKFTEPAHAHHDVAHRCSGQLRMGATLRRRERSQRPAHDRRTGRTGTQRSGCER